MEHLLSVFGGNGGVSFRWPIEISLYSHRLACVTNCVTDSGGTASSLLPFSNTKPGSHGFCYVFRSVDGIVKEKDKDKDKEKKKDKKKGFF